MRPVAANGENHNSNTLGLNTINSHNEVSELILIKQI